MEVAFGRLAVRRNLMPRVDELGSLAQRVIAERFELAGLDRRIRDHARSMPRTCKKKGRPPRGVPAFTRACRQASLMRFARGPFWLGSISKLTRSPPASESTLKLESRPVLWKKYSFRLRRR